YARNSPIRFSDADGRECINSKDEHDQACFSTTVTETTPTVPKDRGVRPVDLEIGVAKDLWNQLVGFTNTVFWMSEKSYGTGSMGPIRGQYVKASNLGQERGMMISTAATFLLPNPFGRRGGVLHQAEVAKIEAQIEAKGLKAVKEY